MNYLILNQLGTPETYSPKSVGKYLAEFLMDANVIPIRRPLRDLIVKVGIVPLRSAKSAKKYESVWTEGGSPLMVNTIKLQKKLQDLLGHDWKVIVGMRYSTPSMQQALDQITTSDPNDRIYFMPLYPHYAQATVYSSVERLEQLNKNAQRKISIIEPFYDKAWYNKAQSQIIKDRLQPKQHLLLSYHGLPISQEVHAGISYQKQCLETSKMIQNELGLKDDQISSAFQSRVGLKKWLSPSTEDTMQALAAKGIKHLAVACPSFVADCLETIEEIGMELNENFIHAGGESFELIPCLNDHDLLIEGILTEGRP
ncbi:MAG: ferrochelatase [Bdellovibrio sp.]|nr:ferrochelatase [Bdellovibrio sp.]